MYNYTNIKRITAAVTFDSSELKDIQNKDEFITSLESVVQDTIGYDKVRGDKITVRDFKFIGVKPIEQVAQTVDENGNAIIVSEESIDTVSMVKSIFKDFSEYIQYIIAAILLLIFYKKFIASNEVVIIGDGIRKNVDRYDETLVKDMLSDYENEFDSSTAQGRLKSKVKSQILNNIDGLDEESAARYEVFIEELDREINSNPLEIARMIELLLNEGSGTFK